jgi:hypothetical protein
MRRFAIAATAGAAALGLGTAATADEVVHYAPKQSDTLAEAAANFAEYNGLMRQVLAGDELTVADMERVHELTYTLEIALAKINEHFSDLPETLETLHLASEAHDAAKLRGISDVYLETAETVVPSEDPGS